MKLDLFVSEVETGQRIPVQMEPMTEADAEQTRTTPRWQTERRRNDMTNRENRPTSDAQWYFQSFQGDREQFYRIFFQMCRKFGVSWRTASPEQKRFIEEITRYTVERQTARQAGVPLERVRPVFDIA